MRRIARFLPFALILPPASWPPTPTPIASGQIQVTAPAQTAPAQTAIAQRKELDRLFVQLRYSERAEEASFKEAEIYLRLSRSSSATTNLLLQNANVAISNQDFAAARAMLNDVVRLDPDFAEGLTRAALLAYQDGDLMAAEGLLKRALRLEPRHFGAWAGLGQVLEDEGNLTGARDAYRQALYLHPFFASAKRGLIRLEAKIDGLSL
jgi:tetratricopeptide (TPR) repeat protein